MTQKEILEVIERRNPDYNKKAVMAWLKKQTVLVKNLDPELAANQCLNEMKEEARIASLEVKKGILLGTIDRKFSRSGKIQKVFVDILTSDGFLERLQWWGSIPKENKTMQTLPILKECLFKGGMTDPWLIPSTGDELINFDVEAIKVSRKKALTPNDLVIPSSELINPSTEAMDLPEGKYMIGVVGKIANVTPYQEKTWDDIEKKFVVGASHALFMSGNLCLTLGIRVNEDLYVKAHFPEQKLGWPTWAISNDLKKVDGIKQVLAKMPVNATTERKMAIQLQNQRDIMISMFKEFSVLAIGEARISRSETVDETRTFIEMLPSYVSISAIDEKMNAAEAIQTVLAAEEEPEVVSVPIGLTEAKLIFEAVNDLGPQGEALAKAKVKELKNQYDRLDIPINLETLIKQAAKELNVDITGYEKAQARIQAESVKAKLDARQEDAKRRAADYKKPLLFELGKVIELIMKNSKIKDHDKIRELIEAKKEELGFFVNDLAAAHIVAKNLNVNTKSLQKSESPIKGTGEDSLDIPAEKVTPSQKKASRKKKTKDKWADHYEYINEVLGTFEEGKEVDTSLLPMTVWDILLMDGGYCFEPQEGVIEAVGANLQLDTKTKKALHKFFNQNPDLQLRPSTIEDIENAARKKLTALKKAVPNASPEHLVPMLASDNIDCPIELVTQIWESL